jgi:hypothetical protein
MGDGIFEAEKRNPESGKKYGTKPGSILCSMFGLIFTTPGKAHVLQAGGDGSGSLVELGVGQTGVIGLAVEQMNEGRLLWALVGLAVQDMDQVFGKLMRTNLGLVVNRHGPGFLR